MDSILETIQKMKPGFERATRNSYISATKDTFIALMYFVVVASVLGLVCDLLDFFNIAFTTVRYLMSAAMVIYTTLGLMCAFVAPRYLAGHLNAKLEGTQKIDVGLYTLTSVVCFCIFTNHLTGLFDITSYGAEQITLALLTTFGVGAIFSKTLNLCTFEMPEGYPPNVEHYLKETIALLVSILLSVLINAITINTLNIRFASLVLQIVIPIFNVFNSVWGLTLIAGFMALIWFSGVHDSSVVDPFIMGAALFFSVQNFNMVHIGSAATGILTPTTRYFIMALGGTGATFVPCLMFKYLSKHERIRQMGTEAWKPVFFGVNEPLLYGVPLVQNKEFMIPFIVTPMVNILIYSFFALALGMGGFAYVLPWFTPAPIAVVICAALNPLSLGLFAALMAVDFLIYLPFFKRFDAEYKEDQNVQTHTTLDTHALDKLEGKKILILCAGGGTSGIVANRMQKESNAQGISTVIDSGAYGAHTDLLSGYDLVVLAPQVFSYLPALKEETCELQLKSIGLNSKQYMSILEDPCKGLQICSESF